jgi:hypothetical protein
MSLGALQQSSIDHEWQEALPTTLPDPVHPVDTNDGMHPLQNDPPGAVWQHG